MTANHPLPPIAQMKYVTLSCRPIGELAINPETPPVWNDRAREIVFLASVYVAMMLGMLGKAWFDHLTDGLALEPTIFLVPLIVSPMVYGAVFKIVQGSDETVLMLIFGFQNGFFWQDVFLKLGSTGTGGGA